MFISQGGAANNVIGFDGTGTPTVEGNLIRFTSTGNPNNHGVRVNTTAGAGNRISANRLYENGGLGIKLGVAGVTANDAGDPDTGQNNLQNFPVLSSVTPAGLVDGSLDSLAANTAYPVRIEFFANTACDSSGNGEGEVYLGSSVDRRAG